MANILGDTEFTGDVEIAAAKAEYFGDADTDGTWRIIRNGDDLVMQRRESGAYVTKQTIAAGT